MSLRNIAFFRLLPLAALLLALAGCADPAGGRPLAVQPSAAQLQIIRGIPAKYVYYPDYEIYYSANYEEYVFHYNYSWMTEPAPMDVTVAQLATARSIPMDFHDDPALHHEEIKKKYPRDGSLVSYNPANRN